MIVGQLSKRDGLAFVVENGVTSQGLPVARLTHGARVDQAGMHPSEVVIRGTGHRTKTAVEREQRGVMRVPTHQHRGIRRNRSKLRKRYLGLLARADICIRAR